MPKPASCTKRRLSSAGSMKAMCFSLGTAPSARSSSVTTPRLLSVGHMISRVAGATTLR
jgi:hypothetical protein